MLDAARRLVLDRRARSSDRAPRRRRAIEHSSRARPRTCCTGWRRRTTARRSRRDSTVAERVLFPSGPTESHGMEDARFVRFRSTTARSPTTRRTPRTTVTRSSRSCSRPTTSTTFEVSTMTGRAAHNKGMALFPQEGRRPVRRARAPRQRQQLPDVLRRRPRVARGLAAPAARTPVGAHATRQLRITARDRGRLAGDHPRRRAVPHATRSVRCCSTSTIRAV